MYVVCMQLYGRDSLHAMLRCMQWPLVPRVEHPLAPIVTVTSTFAHAAATITFAATTFPIPTTALSFAASSFTIAAGAVSDGDN